MRITVRLLISGNFLNSRTEYLIIQSGLMYHNAIVLHESFVQYSLIMPIVRVEDVFSCMKEYASLVTPFTASSVKFSMFLLAIV